MIFVLRKETVGAIVLMALVALLEFILPHLTEATLENKLTDRLSAHDVKVRLSSTPMFFTELGEIDTLTADAYRADIGGTVVSELHLSGEKVKLDMPNLIKNGDININSANELKLVAVITDDDLRHTIENELEMLDDVTVHISPQDITAAAKIKIFGRDADVTLNGKVVVDRGSLVFQMTNLNVKNAFPGTLNLSSMFSNIELVGKSKLILGAKFTDARAEEGKVTITAAR